MRTQKHSKEGEVKKGFLFFPLVLAGMKEEVTWNAWILFLTLLTA